jgi:hypothetical protein
LSWSRSRRQRWPSVALLLHCRIHVSVPPAVIAGWFCVLSVRHGNHNSSAPRWPARSSCRPCGSDLFVLGSSRSRTRGPAKVTWPGFTRSARGRNELSQCLAARSLYPSFGRGSNSPGCGSGVTNHGDGAVVGGAGRWDLLLMDGSVFPVPSSVYWNVWWWSWSMCSHQRWIMLVVGVLSMEVGWVLGESLCLAVGLTMTIPLGAVLLLGGVCQCTASSLGVDPAGEIPVHVGRAAAASLRCVPS